MAQPIELTTLEFLREHGTAPRPDHEKPTVKVPGCVGCGRLHGGVTAEVECLRATVIRLRSEARARL
jgi:hypothetical protein